VELELRVWMDFVFNKAAEESGGSSSIEAVIVVEDIDLHVRADKWKTIQHALTGKEKASPAV